MYKFWLPLVGVLGAVTVGIGAFGAHSLKAILTANGRLDTFETANRYQMYHLLAISLVVLLDASLSTKLNVVWLERANVCFLVGILVFSGSLYTLSLTNITKLGAVAPVGGLAFILGWICLALAVWNK
jgi:uncharacterized membrane protein YgdD (TMEM256/DUF423 family)